LTPNGVLQEPLRYQFTFPERKGPPDPNSNYTFDWQRGMIKVFGRQPASLFFNASACHKNDFCASARIWVNLTGSGNRTSDANLNSHFKAEAPERREKKRLLATLRKSRKKECVALLVRLFLLDNNGISIMLSRIRLQTGLYLCLRV
jgi:hypothetical protein